MAQKRSFLSSAHSLESVCAFPSFRFELKRTKIHSNPSNTNQSCAQDSCFCFHLSLSALINDGETTENFSSEEQRAANGFSSIHSFFKPKSCDTVRRGRRPQKRGKKRAADDAAAAAAAADANDVGGHDDTRARTKEARKRKKHREMNVSVTVLKKGKERNKAPSKKKPYEPSSTAPKKTTDWSSPENAAKLKRAVEGWLNNDRSTYDDRDPNLKLSLRTESLSQLSVHTLLKISRNASHSALRLFVQVLLTVKSPIL